MPSVNLIYQSRNHHTEIIAKAIAEAVSCEAIDISQPHTLPETDLLFIGTGINGAKPDDAFIDYLDQLPVNKILGAAVFSTSPDGIDRTELIVNMLKHKGIEVYPEHFACKGKFQLFSSNHPDEQDCRDAAAFGARVLRAFNG
jgi:flavodoxin